MGSFKFDLNPMKHHIKRRSRKHSMLKKTLPAVLATAMMASYSEGVVIPNSITWLPSDPFDISMDGTHQYDLWLNLSGSYQTRNTPGVGFGFIGFNGNTGYGSFPGNANWSKSIKSQLWNGATQGDLIKISNGTGGGPFPSGSTIYYGGASPVANTDGGTLGARATAISSVQTVTFQLSLGEAYGYTLWDKDGDGFGFEDMPLLSLYDTDGVFLGEIAANYADVIKKAYNGSLEMPPGSGVDEDVYINTFGLQWDLSPYAGSIGSFQVNWTGVQHAQLWSLRLDQSDASYSSFIFDITSYWNGSGDKLWNSPENWDGHTIASTVGKAVFASGDGVVIDSDTTVGQITISSDEDFTISALNNAKLTTSLNIITESTGNAVNHEVSADLIFPTTVTLDVGADTTLNISGNISGTGLYKRGEGDLTLSGSNSCSGNLVFANGTTIVSGVNTTSGGSLLDIKNARVILKGNDRFSSGFGAKLAGTSTHGQAAYLQLGDETTGAITQTLASLNAAKPQYVKDLNPDPQLDPPVYVVGGNSEISTLIVKSGVYSGYLGGGGTHENNLSLVVDGSFTLQGTSTYVGDTVIRTGATLTVNREAALSANSNLVFDGGLLALGSFSYLTPGGVNDVGISVTESFGNFTRSLGAGAGEVQFTGDGGFKAIGADRTVNLGGAGATVTWGEGGFVGNGKKLVLGSESTNKIVFANGINFGNASRSIEVQSNSTAELSGVLGGSGGLVKTGDGSLLLTGTNQYTGATVIEKGQLRVTTLGNAGSNSALGNTSNAASNLILGTGAQFNYVGTQNASTDRLFTIAGNSATIANDGTGKLHYTNTGTVAYDYAGAVTLQLRGTNNEANRFDLRITDNGSYATSLRKGGLSGNANTGGYWIIGNETNSYTGQTFINSGVLEVTKFANGGQNSSIGASSNAAGNLAFFRGGLKYTGAGDSTDRLFSISAWGSTYEGARIDSSGTGALKFTNTGAIGLTSSASGTVAVIGGGGHLILGGTNTDDNTVASSIGGTSTTASRLTKDGSGKWILSGVNSYKGITDVLGGTLSVSNLQDGGVNSNIGSSTNAAANLILNGGTLEYTGAGNSTNRLFTVGVNGGALAASGTGAVNFTNTGAVAYSAAGSRSLTLKGTSTTDNTLALSIGNASGGTTSLVKSDAGKWILSAANSYTGSTQILGGTLSVSNLQNGGSNSNIGASTNAAANLLIDNGTLQYMGAGHSTNRLLTVGTGGAAIDASGTGAVTFSNTGSLAFQGAGDRTLTLTGSNTGNNIFSLAIGDASGGTTSLIKAGVGTWLLNGNNTYSGTTLISGGTLIAGSDNALGSSVATVNGGKLVISSGVTINNDIVVQGGHVERAIGSGSTYSLGASGEVVSSVGGTTTKAALVASQGASGNNTLTYSFSASSSGFAINDAGRQSDVLTLNGTGSDIFVLELQVATVSSSSFLAWYDEGSEAWVNAVDGNIGAGLLAATNGYQMSWEAFSSLYSSYSFSDMLGAWGVDASNGSVWSVINHNSEFAVVPEPSTWALMVGSSGLFYLLNRRRRTA